MHFRDRFWIYLCISIGLAFAFAYLAGLDTSFWTVFAASFVTMFVMALAVEVLGFSPEGKEKAGTMLPRPRTRLKEKFARDLLHRLPLPIMVVEEGGRIVYFNEAARQLVPLMQLDGHYSNYFRSPAFHAAFKSTIEDGEQRSVEFAAVPGERQLEVQLSVFARNLRGDASRRMLVQVHDRTAERATSDLRSSFIANASHELRTPLAAILGYVETLRGDARDDPVAREEFLGIMQEQGMRMQRLVEDLMSLSSIELDEHLAPEGKCDIFGVATAAAEAMQPVADSCGAEIACTWSRDTRRSIRGDRDQLMQVFMNLIHNAAKYGACSVALGARAPDPRFPGMLGIVVGDDGSGIPREHIPHLTERFYRVDAARSREKGGTGLGLAIVKHILNRHGGSLDVESEPGRGSQFTVWLPAEE